MVIKTHTLIIVLILFCVNAFAQKKYLCDSLFNIQKLIVERKWPISTIESAPERINGNPDVIIKVKRDKSCMQKRSMVIMRYIIDLDSTVKCIEVMKSDNHRLDSMAIKQVKTMRFIPAKRRGKTIPYFYLSRVTFIEE